MNHPLLKGTSVLAFVGAGLLAGCHHDHDRVIVVNPATSTAPAQNSAPNTIVVHEAPPAPREESMPSESPPSDKAWAPGHYEYQNDTYVWVSGRWIDKPQPNAEYVAPHWENRSDGWVYVAGYWK